MLPVTIFVTEKKYEEVTVVASSKKYEDHPKSLINSYVCFGKARTKPSTQSGYLLQIKDMCEDLRLHCKICSNRQCRRFAKYFCEQYGSCP